MMSRFPNECCYSPTMEWISVEDRLPKSEFVLCTDGECCFVTTIPDMEDAKEDGVTHWMPLPEPPKPKEPTFKDVFLEKFPKVKLNEYGDVGSCRNMLFGIDGCSRVNKDMNCKKCWNQPYFEEEGEAE